MTNVDTTTSIAFAAQMLVKGTTGMLLMVILGEVIARVKSRG
jgi:hypothetical protein